MTSEPLLKNGLTKRQNFIHEIIFEADTKGGIIFDIALIVSILISIIVVMLDSVDTVKDQYHNELIIAEWGFTILFTIEYILRLYSVRRSKSYAFSFYGIVDLFSILPTYISLFFPGAQVLLVIKTLRVIRVFRVFKLVQFLGEFKTLQEALIKSAHKIIVFVFSILILVIILGTLMYIVEGGENGFTSIPRSVYWAIVTVTTVGYGNISPQTTIGQFIAAIFMIIGYGVIAVPTGVITAQLTSQAINPKKISTQACPKCSKEDHDYDANHCKHCGALL